MVRLHTNMTRPDSDLRFQIDEPANEGPRTEGLDPLSVPGLLAAIHEIDQQKEGIDKDPSLGFSEKAALKQGLHDEKGQRLFLLLGERGNPNYGFSITLFKRDEEEVSKHSKQRFVVDVSDSRGAELGRVGGALTTLSRLPYFNGDSTAVFEFLNPDAIRRESAASFVRRIHDQIRTVAKDYRAAKEIKDRRAMRQISHERDQLIDLILRTRVNDENIEHLVRAELGKGEKQLMIYLTFMYDLEKAQGNFFNFPWNIERDRLIVQAGGYDRIHPAVIDLEDDEVSGNQPQTAAGSSETVELQPDEASENI
jgi:hypothetical protein